MHVINDLIITNEYSYKIWIWVQAWSIKDLFLTIQGLSLLDNPTEQLMFNHCGKYKLPFWKNDNFDEPITYSKNLN